MALAIFDLDNTLLGGDSDHAWGEFVCEQGLVDAATFSIRNDAFYEDYKLGRLNIQAYLRHALSPLKGQTLDTGERWHRQFMREKIAVMLLPGATALLQQHRQRGDQLLIVTASNRYITEPIAMRLGVNELIACEAEVIDGRYTGESSGVPSYTEGKLTRLQTWLEGRDFTLSNSYFYSDSHNDLPLLSAVGHPVAVDPDDTLRQHAAAQNWPIISLRD